MENLCVECEEDYFEENFYSLFLSVPMNTASVSKLFQNEKNLH